MSDIFNNSVFNKDNNEKKTRDFLDVDSTRNKIFENVKKAVTTKYPIKNENYTLHLTDVDYANKKEYSLKDQKHAIMNRDSLDWPLRGKWQLIDNKTNQVISEAKKTIARIPYVTQRGTFIFRGNEYTLSNQARLRPGVYSRRKENGELEAHFNLIPGTGSSFRMFMEPSTGVFKLKIGQGSTPLYPILKILGAQDTDMQKLWGKDIYAANTEQQRKFNVADVYQKLASGKVKRQFSDPDAGIRATFNNMAMDPEVTTRTLGQPHHKITHETLIRTAQKLLNINLGKEEQDDRDNQANMVVYGPEDLFSERISKDAGGLSRNLLWKVSNHKNADAIPSNYLGKQIYAALISSGVGAPITEINPLEILDQRARITRLGEGALSSSDSVPDEARNVQPSQMGLIDIIRSPECFLPTDYVYTDKGFVQWQDVNENTVFACLVNDRLEWHKAEKIHKSYYEGPIYGCSGQAIRYNVTPNHRMYVGLSADSKGKVRRYQFIEAKDLHNEHQQVYVKTSMPPVQGDDSIKYWSMPQMRPKYHDSQVIYSGFDINKWAALLGWYLGEGNTDASGICITQSKDFNPDYYAEIESLLISMGVNFSHNNYRGKKLGFNVNSRQFVDYFKQFGYSTDRFIPEEAFSWPIDARKALLDALIKAEARKPERHKGKWRKINAQPSFMTTSEQLANDVERLALSLGYTVSRGIELDRRDHVHTTNYRVNIFKDKQHRCISTAWFNPYFINEYKGYVHCATVPGGLLFTRTAGGTPFWSGNSQSIGVDQRLALGTHKGEDGQIYREVINNKGKPEMVSTSQLVHGIFAFPGEINKQVKKVRALVNGKVEYVDRNNVNYWLKNGSDMFSFMANMVPALNGVKGGRLMMGARMITQAMPLHSPEAPLLQSLMDGDKSFEEEATKHIGNIYAKQGGRVVKVNADDIDVIYDDGKKGKIDIYNNLPFNQKTTIHNTPMVKPGDQFKANDLLARSNLTDSTGKTAAFGHNLRIAFIPFKGNYEDAIVISESAAKKLTSEHMYLTKVRKSDNTTIGRKEFISNYPTQFKQDQLANIDDNGVIKVGSVVHQGDPLVVGISKKQPKQGNSLLKQTRSWNTPHVETWDHDSEGIVTDVAHTNDGIKVAVKTYIPMKVGDKMCYSKDTLVYTNHGWKFIDSVNPISDKVLALKPNTNKKEFTEIECVHIYPHKNPIYRCSIGPDYVDVTLEHNLYIRFTDESQYRLMRLRDIITLGRQFFMMDKNMIEYPTELKEYSYHGNVYCLELPKHHIFLVTNREYNDTDNGIWCGNSNRYGNKGLVSRIVPDDQMPKDSNGNHFEVIQNPLGLISRTNPSQMVETLLAKIARKTGKPYKLPAFFDKDLAEYALDEARKHGVNETEDIYDPATNRTLKNIYTGEQYIMKLHHTAESKASARDSGIYTQDNTPAKGSAGQSKRLGGLEMNALLAHNVPAVINDAKLIRGQRNDDLWKDLRMGVPFTPPKKTFIYDKFLNMLRSAGVNVSEHDNKVHIINMTDKDVDRLAEDREHTSGESIDIKTGAPVEGGLFDLKITGGRDSRNRWSKITLDHKVPNPLMEEPIRKVLNLTEPEFRKIYRQKDGSDILYNKLANINIDNELHKQYTYLKSQKKSNRNDAVKAIQYLTAAKENNIHPKDWMISKVPVLPAAYRPVSHFDGLELTSDANVLYKELFEANKNLKEIKNDIDDVGDEREAVYHALKAVVGMGDPISAKAKEKNVGGMLTHVFGKSAPKFGTFQQKLLSTTVDSVGRGVIIPDQKLDMDEIGMPEDIAWDLYKPHIMRKLSRKYNTGSQRVPLTELAKWILNRDPRAKKTLEEVMSERPVLYSRAPALHKFSIMAAMPKLTKDNSFRISPVVTPGLGADFDGDASISRVQILVESDKVNAVFGADICYSKHTMPAHFKALLPIKKDYKLISVDLSQFPHTELEWEKQGEKGPIRFYKVPEGIFVPSVHEETGELVFAEVSNWSEHPDREVEIVNLSSGKQIITDDDHRAVYGIRTETLEWSHSRPSNSVGMYVPVLNDFSDLNKETLEYITIEDDSATFKNKLVDRIYLNGDYGYFLGTMIGDGWVTTVHNAVNGQLILSASEPEVAERWKKIVADLFKHEVVITSSYSNEHKFPNSSGSTKHIFNSLKLARHVATQIGLGAENKHLPDYVWEAPNEFKFNLLAGLWDTDGSMTFNQVKGKNHPQFIMSYCSISLRLVYEMKLLFGMFGVNANITTTKTPMGDPCYYLSVSSVDWWDFCHKYGPLNISHETKKANQQKFLAYKEPTRTFAYSKNKFVPITAMLVNKLRKIDIVKKDIKAYGALSDAVRKTGTGQHVTKLAGKYIVDLLQANNCEPKNDVDYERWKQLVISPYVFERVVSFEKTGIRETGYDLTVPGFETFMSFDGVILSNTMNFHVPVSDEAVNEALDKMLPSKNLLHTNNFQVHYTPRQEYLMGLALASKINENKEVRTFATEQDAINAAMSGEIKLSDPIKILDKQSK